MASTQTAAFGTHSPQSNPPHARRMPKVGALFAAMALLAVGCGSAAASDATADGSDDGVATLAALDEETSTEDGSSAGDDAESTPEEAALAFSQCMRDEGLDFPDLAVDAEGNINLREGFESVDRTDESFRDAREACQDELAAGGFGGGGRGAALESPEIQDALVAFSDCVRDQGYDVGDLTLGGQGNGPGQGGGDGTANGDVDAAEENAEGDGDGPAGGQRQQGFGNRSARFAQQLGLDAEDPDVEAAIEACMPIIEDAFADAGIGQGNNNNNANG